MRQASACAGPEPFVLPFFSPEPGTATNSNTWRRTQKSISAAMYNRAYRRIRVALLFPCAHGLRRRALLWICPRWSDSNAPVRTAHLSAPERQQRSSANLRTRRLRSDSNAPGANRESNVTLESNPFVEHEMCRCEFVAIRYTSPGQLISDVQRAQQTVADRLRRWHI